MKLIVLYGPPAAGKYTIAKAVAEKTGYKLFHNHLTVDLVKNIFDFDSPNFFNLCQKIRLDIIEQAAKENITGIIFTFVYEKNIDDEFIKQILEKVTANGGKVIFVQIFCEKRELLKRIKEESRKKFHKIKSEDMLHQTLNASDKMSLIDFVPSLRIDNTRLTSKQAVKKVLEIVKSK